MTGALGTSEADARRTMLQACGRRVAVTMSEGSRFEKGENAEGGVQAKKLRKDSEHDERSEQTHNLKGGHVR